MAIPLPVLLYDSDFFVDFFAVLHVKMSRKVRSDDSPGYETVVRCFRHSLADDTTVLYVSGAKS